MRKTIADEAAEPFRYYKGMRVLTEEDLQAERARIRRRFRLSWWQRLLDFVFQRKP